MNSSVITSFPPSLGSTVSGLAPLLDPQADIAPKFSSTVICAGESFAIPYRVYSPVPDDSRLALLSSSEQTIIACWFTRHHDGYVRERFLRTLTAYDSAWVIAYVVALCGDYVIEILRCIWERRNQFDPLTLGHWLRDNQPFYRRTRSRIISYWNCYYYSSFPDFSDYVGSQLLTFFDDCLSNTPSTGT